MPPQNNPVVADQIIQNLQTQAIGQSLHVFEALPSTNEWMRQHLSEGGNQGTVVVAESQTTGKGRLGRQWFSPAHQNIYLSILLQPEKPPASSPQLTLVAGAAVAETIREQTGQSLQIKWPNDLVVQNKKVGGILCEAIVEQGNLSGVIVGIGINVNIPAEDFPQELQGEATSLFTWTGKTLDRNQLIASLCNQFEIWYQKWLDNGWDNIVAWCNQHHALQDQRVRLTSGPENIEGVVQKIDREGHLALRLDSGTIQTFLEGDTTLL